MFLFQFVSNSSGHKVALVWHFKAVIGLFLLWAGEEEEEAGRQQAWGNSFSHHHPGMAVFIWGVTHHHRSGFPVT